VLATKSGRCTDAERGLMLNAKALIFGKNAMGGESTSNY
jgi:hypothetical protein